jgi:dynein heavy chain
MDVSATCRYTYLLDLAIQHRQPLLMVGPSGTGKTCIIAAHLLSGKGLPQELWMPVAVTLSARTSANMLQDQVRQQMVLTRDARQVALHT